MPKDGAQVALRQVVVRQARDLQALPHLQEDPPGAFGFLLEGKRACVGGREKAGRRRDA